MFSDLIRLGGRDRPVLKRMPAVRRRPHFRSLGAKLTHHKEGPGRPDALDVGGATIYKSECSRREIAERLAHLDAAWHPM